MLRISVAPASASSLAGGPGSQMSSQTVRPRRCAADVDDGAGRAGLEVALLVEDAVVGQVDLAVDRVHGAVGEDGGGVVDVLGALGKADDGDEPARVGGQLAQRRRRVGEEVLLEQQILGRVAGERELGKQDELGAGIARGADPRADALGVAFDVADGGVHLAQGEAHARIVSAPANATRWPRPARNAGKPPSSHRPRAADAIGVLHPRSLLRHPGALIITTLAATDLAYRLLLRGAVRRALGMGAE